MADVFSFNEFTHFDPSNKPTLSLLETQLLSLINYLKMNAPAVSKAFLLEGETIFSWEQGQGTVCKHCSRNVQPRRKPLLTGQSFCT